MEEEVKCTITLNPNDFLIPLINGLKECSNSVYLGLVILDRIEEVPENMYGEDSFRLFQPFGENLDIEQRKTMHKDWVIRKGFEDLIKAVTNTLVGFSHILDMKDQLNEKGITLEKAQKILLSKDTKHTKKHFPELLSKIKETIHGELIYERHIESINKVRNCLVHRNGLVYNLDFNEGNELVLKYVSNRFIVINPDGNREEIIGMTFIQGGSEIIHDLVSIEKRFKEDENIKFSYLEFNDIMNTCFLFCHDLMTKFRL